MSTQSTLKIKRRPVAYRSYLRQMRYVKAHKGQPHLKKLLGTAILGRALRSGVQRLKDLRGPHSFFHKAAMAGARAYNPFSVYGRAREKALRTRSGRSFLRRIRNLRVNPAQQITRNRAATFIQQSLARLAIRKKMRVPFT